MTERRRVSADGSRPGAEPTLRDLTERVKAGDREAAACVVYRFGPLFRQRIRARLARGVRALFDSEDILATVARRLDDALTRDTVRVRDEEHLLALVQRMMRFAVVDKTRLVARLRAADGSDTVWARRLLTQDRGDGGEGLSSDLGRIAGRLEQREDRLQLWLWLRGESQASIARELGITPAAARKRWERLRHTINTILIEA